MARSSFVTKCRSSQSRYSINQKQQLCAFLDNGEVPISNNLAENAIRPFTLGRKNWLFCDTPKGVEASAIVYSLVESAKANGIEPFAYLQHVLVQLPYFGKSPHLMKNWKPSCLGHPISSKITRCQTPMLTKNAISTSGRPQTRDLPFLLLLCDYNALTIILSLPQLLA